MNKKFNLILLLLLILITLSGCLDSLIGEKTKYISISIIKPESRDNLINDLDQNFNKESYTQYDNNLFVWTGKIWGSGQIFISDYEISQPTKYTFKVSGHIRSDWNSEPENFPNLVYVFVTIKDDKGLVLGKNLDSVVTLKNHDNTDFTIQVPFRE
ncbi:MAG: hypothetical protein KAT05_09350 [Spirochaetes bacterium]|nr:hypothetical protein [Spirochaetota bacterium]